MPSTDLAPRQALRTECARAVSENPNSQLLRGPVLKRAAKRTYEIARASVAPDEAPTYDECYSACGYCLARAMDPDTTLRAFRARYVLGPIRDEKHFINSAAQALYRMAGRRMKKDSLARANENPHDHADLAKIEEGRLDHKRRTTNGDGQQDSADFRESGMWAPDPSVSSLVPDRYGTGKRTYWHTTVKGDTTVYHVEPRLPCEWCGEWRLKVPATGRRPRFCPRDTDCGRARRRNEPWPETWRVQARNWDLRTPRG